MSEGALRLNRAVALTGVHLVRAGPGRDAVRLEARGFGLIVGSLGPLWVRGALDAVLLRRFRADRCRVLFIGLHGVAWASLHLPASTQLCVPAVERLHAPSPPPPPPLPELEVRLTITPPEPP